MTPGLAGRIQTRVIVTGLVGGLWTLLVTPLLPRPSWRGSRVSLGAMYEMTVAGLGVVIVIGLAWELVYHGLQQLRWDKDWPSLFVLVTAVNEGVTTWLGLHALGFVPGPPGVDSPFFGVYAGFFLSMWVVIWLFLQGPIRVIAPRWRYRGGRFF